MKELITIFKEFDFLAKVMVITTVVLMIFEVIGLTAMFLMK